MTQRQISMLMPANIIHEDKEYQDAESKRKFAQECGVSVRAVDKAAYDIKTNLPARIWKGKL